MKAKMKCKICHHEEATLHLTQVMEGEIKKLNLCYNAFMAEIVSIMPALQHRQHIGKARFRQSRAAKPEPMHKSKRW